MTPQRCEICNGEFKRPNIIKINTPRMIEGTYCTSYYLCKYCINSEIEINSELPEGIKYVGE